MYDKIKSYFSKSVYKVPEQTPYKYSLPFLYLILLCLFSRFISAKVFKCLIALIFDVFLTFNFNFSLVLSLVQS